MSHTTTIGTDAEPAVPLRHVANVPDYGTGTVEVHRIAHVRSEGPEFVASCTCGVETRRHETRPEAIAQLESDHFAALRGEAAAVEPEDVAAQPAAEVELGTWVGPEWANQSASVDGGIEWTYRSPIVAACQDSDGHLTTVQVTAYDWIGVDGGRVRAGRDEPQVLVAGDSYSVPEARRLADAIYDCTMLVEVCEAGE